MDIHILPSASTPVFSQIVDQIRRLIASGELKEGDELPSIRALAEQLIVNPNTVARAYRELEAKGLLAVRRSSYTYVAATEVLADETKRELVLLQVDRLLADARQMRVPLDLLLPLISSRASETAPLDDASYRRVPIPTLETRRLRLRPVEAGDASRIQALFPHLSVLRYMATAIPWPYPEDGAAEFLSHILPQMGAHEAYFWAILRTEAEISSSEPEGLIGVIGLTPNGHEDHRGFWLGEAYWGQGYMKEACAAVTDFAFDVLEMKEMRLNNAAPNVASHRLKEISGAEIIHEGVEEYIGGRFPSVRWRLTAEAWAANRHRFIQVS